MKKTYVVNVSGSVFGSYDIEAESEQEAKEIANNLPLPTEGEYVEESFKIDEIQLDPCTGNALIMLGAKIV